MTIYNPNTRLSTRQFQIISPDETHLEVAEDRGRVLRQVNLQKISYEIQVQLSPTELAPTLPKNRKFPHNEVQLNDSKSGSTDEIRSNIRNNEEELKETKEIHRSSIASFGTEQNGSDIGALRNIEKQIMRAKDPKVLEPLLDKLITVFVTGKVSEQTELKHTLSNREEAGRILSDIVTAKENKVEDRYDSYFFVKTQLQMSCHQKVFNLIYDMVERGSRIPEEQLDLPPLVLQQSLKFQGEQDFEGIFNECIAVVERSNQKKRELERLTQQIVPE